MTTLGCIGTSSGPLQDVEMAALSCMETSPLIPSASFRSSPLQNMEITTLSCIGRSVYTPSFRSGPFQASFRSGLFQDIEKSTLSCMETSPLIPTAFTIIQPYQSCKADVSLLCVQVSTLMHPFQDVRCSTVQDHKSLRQKISISCRYSSTQDTDDTKFSIVVVLSAPILVFGYS